MTAHPIDTEALQAEIEAAVVDYRKLFPTPWKLSPNLDLAVRALSALAAAEHRATRAEAQSEARKINADYWKRRAERGADAYRQQKARIKAVEDVLDQSRDDTTLHTYPEQLNADIRRALEG